MASGMVGTRRAWVTCAGCGHARIRHLARGRGKCSQAVVTTSSTGPDAGPTITRCDCQRFTTNTKGA